ncbi:MAG: hypothetical protein NXI04_02425 [Planctomycetaceae bacterium]|nr:hypothetical protein [Planctomycetaceae bacterium]
MYRFPHRFVVVTLVTLTAGTAQGQSQPASRQPAAKEPVTAVTEPVSAELNRLLTDWSASSDRIEQLHGKHQRRVYDLAFETERISQGEFGYQKPDKGRITMTPMKITKELLASRNRPDARVERKKDGTPFDLRPDNPERWLCDGERVYDIDEAAKEARVAQLPPEQRGKNIMNTPLPFLFGMPPRQAIKRFRIKIVRDFRPQQQYVALQIEPRTMADRRSWIMAQVMLDTKSYLPRSVRLTDPARTKETTYTFYDMSTRTNLLSIWSNPWDPKLKGYKIQIVHPTEGQPAGNLADNGNTRPGIAAPGPGQPPGRQAPGRATTARVFPNLKHVAHDKAEQALIAAGIPKDNIKKKQAGPAPQANLIYRVSAQYPAAGKPLDTRAEVVLMIYTAPSTARGAAKPAGRSQ